MNEETSAEDRKFLVGIVVGDLTERMIDRQGWTGHDVLVVHVFRHADDAARAHADVDEFHDGIGVHHVAVDGIFAGEHALSDALADDDDGLAAAASSVLKSRPERIGTPSEAKYPGETTRKFARGSSSFVPLTFPSPVKEKPAPKLPASRHGVLVPSDVVDAGKFFDAAHDFTIKVDDLVGGLSV